MIVTSVPCGPRIRFEARSLVQPFSDCAPTFVIRSPRTIPARLAGEPSKTCSTRSPRGSCETVTPMPVKRLSVASWKRAYSFGVK